MSVRKLEQVAPFYFCVDVGQYTGVSAASYEDFLASIKRVDVKSLSFHVDRGDLKTGCWMFSRTRGWLRRLGNSGIESFGDKLCGIVSIA